MITLIAAHASFLRTLPACGNHTGFQVTCCCSDFQETRLCGLSFLAVRQPAVTCLCVLLQEITSTAASSSTTTLSLREGRARSPCRSSTRTLTKFVKLLCQPSLNFCHDPSHVRYSCRVVSQLIGEAFMSSAPKKIVETLDVSGQHIMYGGASEILHTAKLM